MSIRVSESEIYEVESGKIKGIAYNIDNCKNYVACLGIPYAAAPIGELRFEKPQPPKKWRNVRNCTHFGAPCPYREPPNGEHKPQLVHSEDCLFLNVFAPVANNQYYKAKKLPVFVFIHGGGYVFDNAANYGCSSICQNLCSKDVVVVTLNYRLGLFGFLTLNDGKVKGNFGLWDQTEALKWVKKNIHVFGGDPENITVGGHSAGGSSSDLLAISPHSRDLFQRVILFAGASKCGFAVESPETMRRRVWKFAASKGYPKTEADFSTKSAANEDLMRFLRLLKADDLRLGLAGLPAFAKEFTMHCAPVVDGDFFPEEIEKLRKNAPRKQILVGVTLFEGLNLAIGQSGDKLTKFTLRQIGFGLKQKNPQIVQEVYNEMLGSTTFKNTHEQNVFNVNVLSDFFINNGVWESAKNWQNAGSEVFLYTFDYIQKGMLKTMQKYLPFEAACHGVEMAFIFGQNILADSNLERQDLEVLERFTSYLTNFIKHGNPSGDGQVFTPLTGRNLFKHVVIEGNKTYEKDDFCGGRPEKWIQIRESIRAGSKL
ncbi:unnamed protein product [Bursaphelenchus xylophilus]|uniref:Carboxylic ester hydrolase n=1 Tax=Bursaphelenchus xylophilus TaxID=6326 RepID=A0A7I8XJ80_BURXY|nr:unnamed protein product [Bursaphelenchus xylophilus]CAG9125132.1 unnamed protein product [Bursaphelenchus xylophilus]